MTEGTKDIALVINGVEKHLSIGRKESLLDVLRRHSYLSVKRGCDTGDCGVCTVLLDDEPVRSCMIRAAAVDGHAVTTVEGLSQDGELHPIQQAFAETGASQCGFCTPAQVLTAKALLDKNPNPSEDEIREAMSGVICRCTGYVRTVEAVQRAAALLSGETVPPVGTIETTLPEDADGVALPDEFYRRKGGREPLPPLILTPSAMKVTQTVGQPQVKVDAEKLVRGRPVFTDDVHPDGMLYGMLLTSPHAHARIKRIDASRARALPGVPTLLTYQDPPRITDASGGQRYPNPPPYDQVC